MKRLLWTACLLITSIIVDADAPLSPEDFTDQFAAAFRQAEPEISFEENGLLSFQATASDGNQLAIYLDNAYQQYLAGAGTPEEVIAQHIASVSETLHNDIDAPLEISQVLPVIKSLDYLQAVEEQFSTQESPSSGPALHSMALNQDLIVLYALDTPTSMRYLSPSDLEELGLNGESLHQKAKVNLQRYFEQQGGSVQQLDTDGQGDIFIISIDEIYETSSLLVELPQDSSLFPVKGQPVVFLPARGTVLVVGSEDKAGLALASHISRLAYEDMGYSISPFGYWLTGEGWRRHH